MRRQQVLILSGVVALALLVACGGGTSGGSQPAGPQTGGVNEAQVTIYPTPTVYKQPAGAFAFPTRAPAETPTEAAAEPSATEASATEPTAAEAATEASAADATPVAIEALGSADAMDTAWTQARALAPGMPFMITTDEATAEAAIEAGVTAALARTTSGASITDLNVTLADGKISMAFIVMVSSVGVHASAAFVPTVDDNSKLVLTVDSATVETVDMPELMLAAISDGLTAAITGASAQSETQVTLTEITAENGQLTVAGFVTK